MRRVGVLLSGCGIYDGSEVQETVLLIFALKRLGMRPVYLAPDIEQRDVVNHATGETVEKAEPRHVVTESARLTRGVIQTLGEVSALELDALVIPGGLGVVKNLCSPGTGALGGGPPRPEVAALLRALGERGSPVGVIGLADVVLARHQDRPLGQEPVSAEATGVIVDAERRTLFTPGFLGSDSVTDVALGIERLVEQLGRWLGVSRALMVQEGRS